tara:strand:+ start:14 stop:529 length:516 start_codon:yes stop_codon:yes gene_type:complete
MLRKAEKRTLCSIIMRKYDYQGDCNVCGHGVWTDSGVDPGKIPEEHGFAGYVLKDSIWRKTGLSASDGVLCINCAQEEIGRDFTPSDFKPIPMNFQRDGIIDYLFPEGGDYSPEILAELIELIQEFLRRMEKSTSPTMDNWWSNFWEKNRRRACREMADEELNFLFNEGMS